MNEPAVSPELCCRVCGSVDHRPLEFSTYVPGAGWRVGCTLHICAACSVVFAKAEAWMAAVAMKAEAGAADPVNAPAHYTTSGLQPIAVIEAWQLGFCLGNTVKYIARAEHKNSPLEDLKKARWYLDREIARRESQGTTQ